MCHLLPPQAVDEASAAASSAPRVALSVGSIDEPDVRRGAAPALLNGTLTVTGLEEGAAYSLFRWDATPGGA